LKQDIDMATIQQAANTRGKSRGLQRRALGGDGNLYQKIKIPAPAVFLQSRAKHKHLRLGAESLFDQSFDAVLLRLRQSHTTSYAPLETV
jgi:hypothetical protein